MCGVCLCLVYGGVGGVGGEWVDGGLGPRSGRVGYVVSVWVWVL